MGNLQNGGGDDALANQTLHQAGRAHITGRDVAFWCGRLFEGYQDRNRFCRRRKECHDLWWQAKRKADKQGVCVESLLPKPPVPESLTFHDLARQSGWTESEIKQGELRLLDMRKSKEQHY